MKQRLTKLTTHLFCHRAVYAAIAAAYGAGLAEVIGHAPQAAALALCYLLLAVRG